MPTVCRCVISAMLLTLLNAFPAGAADYFLTIGGGYSPSGNQASLEKNVLYYQRILRDKELSLERHHIFFADGSAPGHDLQVVDRESVPKATRLMAELFGSSRNLGLSYRNHAVPEVKGATDPVQIRQWFSSTGQQMSHGDRLVLYVTSHGGKSDDRDAPHDTSITLWNNQKIKVSQLVGLLDKLPDGVSVVAIMVQCHAGGFARFIYNDGNPANGLSKQNRCGFFATVHDRPAAGCTPEINEATYVEYSTFFWEALSGKSRTGDVVEMPDYDGDGSVSFAEAHAYTLLKSDTIDLPIKTSGEFLGVESLFSNDRHPELLSDDEDFETVLELATPAEAAVLVGLSEQLKLTGKNRIAAARRESQARRGSRSRSQPRDPSLALRQGIARDLKRRWPALANVLNPVSIELITTRSDEFIRAVEKHGDYQRYRELAEKAEKTLSVTERKVKFERFVRTAENVILRENLVRLDDSDRLAEYNVIVTAESRSLTTVSEVNAAARTGG